ELAFPPPDPYSLYYLGRIRSDQSQRSTAISFFTKSIDAGEVLDVRQRLASSYLAVGRLDEAIRFLETSVILRPGDGGVHYLLARAYKQKGADAKSKVEFEAAARWKAKFRNEMVALTTLRNDLRTSNETDAIARSKELFASGDSDILLASATALGQAGLH